MDTIKFDHSGSHVRMIAHQGIHHLETGNTCAGFVAAGNRSYYGIETDVHVTADGQYVILHDDNTLRTTGEDHIIEQTDFDLLRRLTQYDMNGEAPKRCDLTIPTLREYTRICRKYEKVSVLELKNHMKPVHVAGVVNTIRSEGWLENTIFISFDHANLVELRRLLPKARLMYLTIEAIDEAMLEKLLPWQLELDARYFSLTKENIALMHAYGVEVNCWNLDDPVLADQLIGWGVDYITTNILE